MQLHELFDKARDEADEWMDVLAERAVQLGGAAEGTPDAVTQHARVPGFGTGLSDGRELVAALSESEAALANSARRAIDAATEAGDLCTADIFTEIARGADRMLWFLESHLEPSTNRSR